MKQYLDNYIRTQSGRRQEQIHNLLEEARVGKAQIDSIYRRIAETVDGFSPVDPALVRSDSLVRSGTVNENVRNFSLRFSELYNISNLIALLLQSHASVQGAEIKRLEDEILAMEKMVDNYAFLLSDAKAYDFAYLEPFSDTRRRDDMEYIPDRSAVRMLDSSSKVNTAEGVLELSSESLISYKIFASVIDSNVNGFARFQTDLSSAVSKNNKEGWNVEVVAPRPVTTKIDGAVTPGAQYELEFSIQEPSPSSHIKLSPFSDLALEVHKITIFTEENGEHGQDILTQPVKLDRIRTFPLPLQAVKKFRVVLSQPTYTRGLVSENHQEFFAKAKLQAALDRYANPTGKGNKDTPQPSAYYIVDNIFNRPGSITQREDFEDLRDSLRDKRVYSSAALVLEMLNSRPRMLAGNKIAEGAQVLDRTRRLEIDPSNGEDTYSISLIQGNVPTTDGQTGSKIRTGYSYKIGLRSVEIGVTNSGYKGAFVSSPLPSPGDVGALRIKVGEENYFSPDLTLDSRKLTSVEYSVSHKNLPTDENDWTPILPIGQTVIEGEKLMLSEQRVGYFRFPADAGQQLAVYRNGFKIDGFSPIYGNPNEMIGIAYRDDMSPTDNITVDYSPAGDRSVVEFEDFTMDNAPLTSAFDEEGVGEGFLRTENRNIVTLSQTPYVEEEGNPVKVELFDGSFAINITDYSVTTDPTNFADDDENVYFKHSGRTLLFSREVTDPFRVYYQYLESNLRFRVVLRCNAVEFVTPRVDFVHVKAKTRQARKVSENG